MVTFSRHKERSIVQTVTGGGGRGVSCGWWGLYLTVVHVPWPAQSQGSAGAGG